MCLTQSLITLETLTTKMKKALISDTGVSFDLIINADSNTAALWTFIKNIAEYTNTSLSNTYIKEYSDLLYKQRLAFQNDLCVLELLVKYDYEINTVVWNATKNNIYSTDPAVQATLLSIVGKQVSKRLIAWRDIALDIVKNNLKSTDSAVQTELLTVLNEFRKLILYQTITNKDIIAKVRLYIKEAINLIPITDYRAETFHSLLVFIRSGITDYTTDNDLFVSILLKTTTLVEIATDVNDKKQLLISVVYAPILLTSALQSQNKTIRENAIALIKAFITSWNNIEKDKRSLIQKYMQELVNLINEWVTDTKIPTLTRNNLRSLLKDIKI